MGFRSREELDAACDVARAEVDDIRSRMKAVEAAIKEKKEFRNHLTGYFKTKQVADMLSALNVTGRTLIITPESPSEISG